MSGGPEISWAPATTRFQWQLALVRTGAACQLPPSSWAVIAAITRHASTASDAGWTGVPRAYPSAKTIAEQTGIGVTSATAGMQALAALGALKAVGKVPSRSGRGAVTLWELRSPTSPESGEVAGPTSPESGEVEVSNLTGIRAEPHRNPSRTSPESGDEGGIEGGFEEGPPSPYCADHPNGIDTPCPACGRARTARKAWDAAGAVRRADALRQADQALITELSGPVRSTKAVRDRAKARAWARPNPECSLCDAEGVATVDGTPVACGHAAVAS